MAADGFWLQGEGNFTGSHLDSRGVSLYYLTTCSRILFPQFDRLPGQPGTEVSAVLGSSQESSGVLLQHGICDSDFSWPRMAMTLTDRVLRLDMRPVKTGQH